MQGLAELLVLVTVGQGILEGELVQNEFGGSFYSFKGIPYAQPPVGDLRFKAPQPPTPWEGVRDAKQFGSNCVQLMVSPEIPTTTEQERMTITAAGSEDCLYLNVYTPDINPDTSLPVMFWIHGGAFLLGSGNDDFYGPEFLIREDVIIVTFNYRLEVLGFLSLDSEDIPGNAGMKDQVAALRWVVENISNFGGDPNNITVFGQSAGGVSTSYFLISPMTKGLFKRAIVQSGSALNNWAHAYKPRERALALARQLGLFSEDDKALYEFFKNQPIENLVGISVPIIFSEIAKPKPELIFTVATEKQFDNQETFFAGDFYSVHEDVEIMFGYTSEEGIFGLESIDNFNHSLALATDFPEFFISRPLRVTVPVKQLLDIGKKIKQFYYNDQIDLTGASWEELVDFLSMDMFTYQIVQNAKLCAKTNKVYLYRFSCKTERNAMTSSLGLLDLIGDTPVTAHGDDILYLFDAKMFSLPLDTNSDTFQLIQRVVKLWTNFAKYGNPTPDESLGAVWKPYTLENEDYFEIGNVFSAGTAPDDEQIKFWDSIHNTKDISNGVERSHSFFVLNSCVFYMLYLILHL